MHKLFVESTDIYNLEIAEKIINESLDGFLALFHSSPACMSITTVDRTFVQINERFRQIYGFGESEVIGRNSLEIGILDEAEHKRVSQLMLTNGCIKNETIRCKNKSGATIYAISSIEQMEINNQLFWVSSFLDITHLKQQQLIIETQNKEILESIRYARLIQEAVFPTEAEIKKIIPEIFVLNKPKHIVSGDFYWIKEHNNKIYIAVCDCTGHGVPGGFISIIGYKLLNKFVLEYEFSSPADILNQMNTEFLSSEKNLLQDAIEIKDGMDISLCVIDKSTMNMEYAGAYNPIYQVRNGVLTKLSTDKIPIHLFSQQNAHTFTNYTTKIKPGDAYYLFSDGYADQFGGPKRKKFRYKNFQNLILSLQHEDMPTQKEILNKTIDDWKTQGEEEQTDDILILGFKM